MAIDHIVLIAVGVVSIALGVYVIFEAKRYQARRRHEAQHHAI